MFDEFFMHKIVLVMFASFTINGAQVSERESLSPLVENAVGIVKRSAINVSLANFDFSKPDISNHGSALQTLQEIMKPIKIWLGKESKNLELFFTQSGLINFSDAVKENQEYSKLFLNALNPEEILSDSTFDAAISRANSKYKTLDPCNRFNEDLYLWLVQYVMEIKDLNQIKGEPVWKVRYAGKINGIFYPENKEITIKDVNDLVEQQETQRQARMVMNDIERVERRNPDSVFNFCGATFEPCYNSVMKFHVRIFCSLL